MRILVPIAALALTGCALGACTALTSPMGVFSRSAPAVVTRPGSDAFEITTGADGDARIEAQDFCARRSRLAKLVRARRIAASDPAQDRIRWHFDCIT